MKPNDPEASGLLNNKAIIAVHLKPMETRVIGEKWPPAIALLRNSGCAAVHAVAGDHVDDAIILPGEARVLFVVGEIRFAAVERRSARIDVDLFMLDRSILTKLIAALKS
jgi:hypothetical protein